MANKKLTKREIVLLNRQNLTLFDIMIDKGIYSLYEVDEIMPGHFHINDRETLAIEYFGKSSCEFLNKPNEELVAMGRDFLEKYIHPDSSSIEHPKLISYFQSSNNKSTYCYFEKVRKSESKDIYEWFMSLCSSPNSYEKLLCFSIPLCQIEGASKTLTQVVDDNLFLRKNYLKFCSLSKREVEIIKMVEQGWSRRGLANKLNISILTIDTHRKNIREKLEVSSFREVSRYIRAFNLL